MGGPEIVGLVFFAWVVCGVMAHVIGVNKYDAEMRRRYQKKTSLWDEGFTYVMLFPAIVAGPFLLLIALCEKEKPMTHRHKHRGM
jgi:hypothetical protein